jgi:hypothetical protein
VESVVGRLVKAFIGNLPQQNLRFQGDWGMHLTVSSEESIPVRIVKNTESSSTGQIVFRERDRAERLWRAARTLAIFWTLAIFSILIPLLHFVLVPGFLLLGAFMFFGIYSEHISNLGGKGICPECKKEFDIVGGKSLPYDDICNLCRAHFKIER